MSTSMPMIFVHVHYPEIWEDMAREIAELCDKPFGLVLTHYGSAPLARPQTPCLAFCKEIVVENRGRDVLPFLQALRADLPPFEIGLKLHTKRSPHRDDGPQWRQFLTASLLAHNDEGLSAYQLMSEDSRIGIIAPQGHLLPLLGRVALNGPQMKKMLATLGINASIAALDDERFAAGTMFWFRRKAVVPFMDPALKSLFEPEESQLDGTAAHAAERLFAFVCEKEGFFATAMEAVTPLLAAIRDAKQTGSDAVLPLATLRSIWEQAYLEAVNPFSMPLASFWAKHRKLLLLAHLTYRHVPSPVWRAARRLIRRYTKRDPSDSPA
jgi:lipopolysaccharide biosynthesis protein